jgi:predicted kinase
MSLVRPSIERPICRVILVCGPPASGKSTYVRVHAKTGDTVLDLDEIAAYFGLRRGWPSTHFALVLREWGQRLRALAQLGPKDVAWVVMGAPLREQREYWTRALGVKAEDLIVLTATREELFERIRLDPERSRIRSEQVLAVRNWFELESRG